MSLPPMRLNTAYAGYPYQRKCALLYLFKRLHDEEFTHFGLEDIEGDDFSLYFVATRHVYQVKGHDRVSSMKAPMIALWTRYKRNIQPAAKGTEVKLSFIFSCLSPNKVYLALRNCDPASGALAKMQRDLAAARDVIPPVRSVGWRDFIERLGLEYLPAEELDEQLESYIASHFDVYKLSSTQRDKIRAALLEKIDTIMASNRKVPKNEFREAIDFWHHEYWGRHPRVRREIEKSDQDILRRSIRPTDVAVSSTGEVA